MLAWVIAWLSLQPPACPRAYPQPAHIGSRWVCMRRK